MAKGDARLFTRHTTMEDRTKRKNPAAKALMQGEFRHRIVANKKGYNRSVERRKAKLDGERDN